MNSQSIGRNLVYLFAIPFANLIGATSAHSETDRPDFVRNGEPAGELKGAKLAY